MKRARGIADFVSDPVGRFDVGGMHVVWCHSRTLCGSFHWSRPTEADARDLVGRLELTRHPALAGGFDVLMDSRGVESFEWEAFTVVSDYTRSRLDAWNRQIRRHAILAPPGTVGILVAGLLPLLGPNYPFRFFEKAEDALAWLDRKELPEVLAQMEAVAAGARGVSPLLRALAERLDRSLKESSIDVVARALAMSPRTLQRELRGLGTRFSHELVRARLRAACARLEHSDEKIEAIARGVGCSSSSQLSVLFRRELGETPAEYRTRKRASATGIR